MPRYLVTGGAGFIGSHLVDSLVADGHAVCVIDDLSTGSRDNLNAAVDLRIADVADRGAVREALDGVDGCFHLAAIASVERSQREWLRAHHGMDEYIESMKRHGEMRGKALGTKYAEGFIQHRGHPYPQDDLLTGLFAKGN